jgi:hypothetical protein
MTAERSARWRTLSDLRGILRTLRAREREGFLAVYREAVDGARDPEGRDYLRRVLLAWSARAVAVGQPGFYETEDAALNGTGEGCS